jgi:hypothetical protein
MTLSSSDRLATRQDFRVPWDYVPELTPPRSRYVQSFLRQLGYEPDGLDDNSLIRVFSLLARVEEYATDLRHNGHNWELDYSSLERVREATEPVLDKLVLEWVARGLLSPLSGNVPRWPSGKRFCLCLTHDMDTLKADVWRNRVRSLPHYRSAPLSERAIVAASTACALARRLIPGRCPPDPLLSEWMDEEEKHGFRSSFFFFAQPLPQPDWQDSFDSYEDRVAFDGSRLKIRAAMREIASRGWDVGLHASSRSHTSARLLAHERRIVGEACGDEVLTARQHHLFFDARCTPLCQAEAGLQADSTLGSNIRPCFRCGTGMPFFWYDLVDDRELDVLQAPLIIQDVALFNTLQMDVDTAVRHCVGILRETARLGGALTLLWHNNYYEHSPAFLVYRVLLEEAARLGAWGCSLRELSHWWRKRRALASMRRTT